MHLIRLVVLTLALTACNDQPARTVGPRVPPPPQAGVAAFISVDRLDAQPGQTVRVRVEVQLGTQQTFKLGSYTGRLHFNAASLQFQQENKPSDGLRVSNPANALKGEIRFAGADPGGFTTLVLYDGTFTVKTADYAQGLSLVMEELSAASSLANLRAALKVNPQIFLSRTPN
jgi:hypothetical protein